MLFLEEKELPPGLRRQVKKAAEKAVEETKPVDESTLVLRQVVEALKLLVPPPAAAAQDYTAGIKGVTDTLLALAAAIEKAANKKQPPRTWKFDVTRNYNGLISGITAKQT